MPDGGMTAAALYLVEYSEVALAGITCQFDPSVLRTEYPLQALLDKGGPAMK